MIFIEKGDFYLGHRIKDGNGNIIQQNGPEFEPDDNGSSVIVGKLDSETRKQVGEADIFGDFNAAGYLKKVLELLTPGRTINIPNFKELFVSASKDNVDMCDYCEGLHCDNCIVSEWKESLEVMKNDL